MGFSVEWGIDFKEGFERDLGVGWVGGFVCRWVCVYMVGFGGGFVVRVFVFLVILEVWFLFEKGNWEEVESFR